MGSWLRGECAVLIVFKQELLLMYVLLLSIFMAVIINSVMFEAESNPNQRGYCGLCFCR